MADKQRCLPCSVRDAILDYYSDDRTVVMNEVIEAVGEVMGELIGACDVEAGRDQAIKSLEARTREIADYVNRTNDNTPPDLPPGATLQ